MAKLDASVIRPFFIDRQDRVYLLEDFTSQYLAGKMLVIHPRFAPGADGKPVISSGWSITHRATGREVCFAPSFEMAKKVASGIYQIPGWHDCPAMMARTDGFYQAVKAAATRLGGRFAVAEAGVMGAGWVRGVEL